MTSYGAHEAQLKDAGQATKWTNVTFLIILTKGYHATVFQPFLVVYFLTGPYGNNKLKLIHDKNLQAAWAKHFHHVY